MKTPVCFKLVEYTNRTSYNYLREKNWISMAPKQGRKRDFIYFKKILKYEGDTHSWSLAFLSCSEQIPDAFFKFNSYEIQRVEIFYWKLVLIGFRVHWDCYEFTLGSSHA
jgi:hypothetical protein